MLSLHKISTWGGAYAHGLSRRQMSRFDSAESIRSVRRRRACAKSANATASRGAVVDVAVGLPVSGAITTVRSISHQQVSATGLAKRRGPSSAGGMQRARIILWYHGAHNPSFNLKGGATFLLLVVFAPAFSVYRQSRNK